MYPFFHGCVSIGFEVVFQVKAGRELFRRRNCFIKCTSVLLRDSLIYEAFENTRILFLDWLGQHLDSNIVEESLLPQLEKLGTDRLTTVCIFDLEFADKLQLQSILRCLRAAPESVKFVVQASSGSDFGLLKDPIVFDCSTPSSDEGYITSSIEFVKRIFYQEGIYQLEDQFLKKRSSSIGNIAPELLEQLVKDCMHDYLDKRQEANFKPVEDIEKVMEPIFDSTIQRLLDGRQK